MPSYGLIHYRVPGTMEQFLDYAKNAGFDCAELSFKFIMGLEGKSDESKTESVARMVKARGLKVSALGAGNDFNVLDADAVKAQVELMKKVCRHARILGTNTIRTEGGAPKESASPGKWVEAISNCLKRCLDFAEKDGMFLAVDNHGLITNEKGILPAIFEKVGSRRVGTNVDFMNYRWFGHDAPAVLEIVREVAPHAMHTHVKDGVGSRQNYKGQALGDGEIPLLECVKALKDAGYRGAWCAEYEGPEVEGGVGYKKCLDWMKKHIK